jgi:drug/metabolite transporter (DMT)-like permease
MPLVWTLGAVLFVSFALQSEGLKRTTPGQSAFLTGLTVAVVPIVVWCTTRVRPTARSWSAVGLAAIGLVLLYAGSIRDQFGLGESLSALCAVGFAGHVVLSSRVAHSADLVTATAVQLGVVAIASGCIALFEGSAPESRGSAVTLVAVVAYSGALATALAFGCQLFAQSRIGAVETGVILALEPVVALGVSVAIGRDAWSSGFAFGAACLMVAAALSSSDSERAPDLERQHQLLEVGM